MDAVVAGLILGAKAKLKTAGESITAGKLVGLLNDSVINAGVNSPTQFEAGGTNYTWATQVSTDKILIVYQDGGNSSYGTSIILSIVGASVLIGTPFVFNSGGTTYTSVCMVAANKALAVYNNGGDTNKGTAIILSVSGTTITAGSPVVFETGASNYTNVCQLTTDKAIAVYADQGNSGYGTACAMTVSGTTITAGTPVVFESADSYDTVVANIGIDKAMVAYRNAGNSYYATACVMTISGTTITAGTPAVIQSVNGSYLSISSLGTDKAITTYNNQASTNDGTAACMTISGTTITVGTPVVFNSNAVVFMSNVYVSADKTLVAYRDSTSTVGKCCILTTIGTVITAGSEFSYTTFNIGYVGAAIVASDKVLIAYQDQSSANEGKASLVDISSAIVTSTTVLATGYAPIASMLDGDGVSKVVYIPN